ncbi:MAG: deoxyribose-phosphate aldolase [Opitutaceae bacterium]
MTPAELAATLDSTNLRLDATEADLGELCRQAALHRFACVMLYPSNIAFAARQLAGSGVRVGTVIGFPSGRFSSRAKHAEIEAAQAAGAHEVDIVMNYAALRDGRAADAADEISALTATAHGLGLLVKIIVETCYLDQAQRLVALQLCEAAGADFIKTSTGFGSAGAVAEHLREWSAARTGTIRLKASGGIKTLAVARALLAAGASRLGTSSAAEILAELGGRAAAVREGY